MSTPGNYPPPPPPKPTQNQGSSAIQPQGSYSSTSYTSSWKKLETAGFFQAFFDLDFHHFVTLKFAKLIFIIEIVIVALSVVVTPFLVYGMLASSYFYEDEASSTAFIVFLLSLIGGAVSLILCRLGLELSVAIIRIAENTTYLRQQNAQNNAMDDKS